MELPANFEQITGLQVTDLREDSDFVRRSIRPRDFARQMSGLHRLSHAFIGDPEGMLNELVTLAIDLCGAESAGISVEKPDGTDESFYNWIAAAGDYEPFFNAMLPRYPSACSICLQRDEPQRFRVSKTFFDILGVEAPPVTDGLLLPWHDGDVRGTIFIMAHTRTEAFDSQDLDLMRMLANFAAMANRSRRQQAELLKKAELAAAASMADRLAHKINNPLQSLTNLVYINEQQSEGENHDLAKAMRQDLDRLSLLVQELLAVPTAANARYRHDSTSHSEHTSS